MERSIGLVLFPPWGGEGWGLTGYWMPKPLPANSHLNRTPPVGRELKIEMEFSEYL